jgi:hypothetical protein
MMFKKTEVEIYFKTENDVFEFKEVITEAKEVTIDNGDWEAVFIYPVQLETSSSINIIISATLM